MEVKELTKRVQEWRAAHGYGWDNLYDKLLEEVREVYEATNQDELRDEIADVLIVMLALIQGYGWSADQIVLDKMKKRPIPTGEEI
jgi:NTP pyrophosphatase (non-canonical NTP hydrolase)